jgi:hypothetical protein
MVVLKCAAAALIGFTYPLTNMDQLGIKRAYNHCKQTITHPCLIQIKKVDQAKYDILCEKKK